MNTPSPEDRAAARACQCCELCGQAAPYRSRTCRTCWWAIRDALAEQPDDYLAIKHRVDTVLESRRNQTL